MDYPARVHASSRFNAEVTEWKHLYDDRYQCRCCGWRLPYADLVDPVRVSEQADEAVSKTAARKRV